MSSSGSECLGPVYCVFDLASFGLGLLDFYNVHCSLSLVFSDTELCDLVNPELTI